MSVGTSRRGSSGKAPQPLTWGWTALRMPEAEIKDSLGAYSPYWRRGREVITAKMCNIAGKIQQKWLPQMTDEPRWGDEIFPSPQLITTGKNLPWLQRAIAVILTTETSLAGQIGSSKHSFIMFSLLSPNEVPLSPESAEGKKKTNPTNKNRHTERPGTSPDNYILRKKVVIHPFWPWQTTSSRGEIWNWLCLSAAQRDTSINNFLKATQVIFILLKGHQGPGWADGYMTSIFPGQEHEV